VSTHGHRPAPKFEVELPAGGKLPLLSLEEVELWETTRDRYLNDYAITQQNDKVTLGGLLTQQLVMFRAQQRLAGLEPEFDDATGLPTGHYKRVGISPGDMSKAQSIVTKASEEIREGEKVLGIDKKTREAGGQHTVANYVETLKMAARSYGVHLSKRLKAYEKVMMEARWKLRLLRNGDPEDRQYHGLTEQSFIAWLEEELAKIEEVDREYARDKGKLWVGKV
jgi:hypothetical protein